MITPFIIIVSIISIWEFSFLFGFGCRITNMKDFDLTDYSINPFDHTVINNYSTNEQTRYVTAVPSMLSLFFKYHIEDHGLVFRFTKLAKKIDAKFKELENANSNA